MIQMRIRIVSKQNEIAEVNNEIAIHLAFRPSNKNIFAIVENNKEVKAIQLPKSYMKTISESITTFLNMQGIKLIEGDVWGHRKDINPYFDISDGVIKSFKSGELDERMYKGNIDMLKAMLEEE